MICADGSCSEFLVIPKGDGREGVREESSIQDVYMQSPEMANDKLWLSASVCKHRWLAATLECCICQYTPLGMELTHCGPCRWQAQGTAPCDLWSWSHTWLFAFLRFPISSIERTIIKAHVDISSSLEDLETVALISFNSYMKFSFSHFVASLKLGQLYIS